MIRLVVFLAAALLFLVQPMMGRLVLPELGGSAAVWTTCLAFFQLTLLAGYLYAHALGRWLSPRAGAAVHLGLVALAGASLPVGLAGAGTSPVTGDPTGWLLAALLRGVGPTFLALAATTPLVQRWLASSRRPGARDPYYLFAASNLGSLAALVGYPFLVEPALGLGDQVAAFSAGYAALAAGLVAVAAHTLGAPATTPGGERAPAGASPEAPEQEPPPSASDRLAWLVLAFVPASFLMGVSAHMANEVPGVSLLWVTPLALYLSTFALAFSRRRWVPTRHLVALHPPLLCLLAVILYVPTRVSGFLVHLAAFSVSALLLHTLLADRRPPARYLTEFYLWLATGGALAGLFHALVAPRVFPVFAEYPLAVLAAAALQPEDAARPEGAAEAEAQALVAAASGEAPEPAPAAPARPPLRRADVLAPLGMAAALVAALLALPWTGGPEDTWWRVGLLALGGMLANSMRGRRVRFPLAVGAVLVAGFVGIRLHGVVTLARSFHGVHRVVREAGSGRTRLYFGSTVHGVQEPPGGGGHPTSYYHPESPIGDLLRRAGARRARLGVVGLGAGSLAWYTEPGQRVTVFELDPTVARLAGDPRYFTFLSQAAGEVEVVLGDGRRQLRASPHRDFDLLLLDAFSSDAVPVHMLTREALALYRDRLAPRGVLVVHASNRHLRLEVPALAGLAALGLEARLCPPRPTTPEDEAKDIATATWVAAARRAEDLEPWLAGEGCWQVPARPPREATWTDDHVSLLPLLRRTYWLGE